jgi:hypothetical protein
MTGAIGDVGGMFGFGGGAGEDAAEASIEASEIQAAYQREALDYLKEREEIPQQYREEAIQQLAGYYGLPGGTGDQGQMIEGLRQTPLYEAIMGTQEAGEEAILRQAAATGGLRSGTTQAALADQAQRLQQEALLQSYNQQVQGLQGLAGLPSLAPMIAQQTGGIGQTLGQGQVAAAQAELQGQQAGFGNLLGAGQLGLQAYQAFSDRRLKKNIRKLGEKAGLGWYSWEWNDEALKLDLDGSGVGFMADEVEEVYPDMIGMDRGYKTVNYEGLLNGV